MKNSFFTNKLISSIFITILLLYFMIKTTSPKIIFVPFLICSVSMIGKNIALILNKKKLAVVFSKLFIGGFLLFWFGFLAVAGYICVRDKNYTMMIFSLPFWLVGIYFVKNRLLNIKAKNNDKSKFQFGIIVSAALVIIVLLSGVVISVLGIMEHNVGLIFAGAFFAFGAFTFVLGALTVKGYFDKLRIDVLGVYIGILFVIIGIGFVALKYGETYSVLETIQAFGFWILIPIMMIVAGVYQTVKSLKDNHRKEHCK